MLCVHCTLIHFTSIIQFTYVYPSLHIYISASFHSFSLLYICICSKDLFSASGYDAYSLTYRDFAAGMSPTDVSMDTTGIELLPYNRHLRCNYIVSLSSSIQEEKRNKTLLVFLRNIIKCRTTITIYIYIYLFSVSIY